MKFCIAFCLMLLGFGALFAGDGEAPREVAAFEIPALSKQRAEQGRVYLEFLRVSTLSAGLYELPAGAEDHQPIHERDEIYYVVNGRANFASAGHSQPVAPGSVIYVRAGVAHRFTDIAEPLQVLVVFSFAPPAPAERE